jgi:rhodanese-related sulfurtransferase
MVAQNSRAGLQAVSPLSPLAGHNLLDVRHTEEQQSRPLNTDGVRHVPQNELGKVDTESIASTDLVVCERGTRSAEVVRWLAKRGISACYLGGGLRWRELTGLPLA